MKRLGMLNKRLMAVHMNWLTDEEIRWCGEEGVNVICLAASKNARANLRNKSLDFRGFDSSIILILRGGILVSIGMYRKFESSNLSRDNLSRVIGRSILRSSLVRDDKAGTAPTLRLHETVLYDIYIRYRRYICICRR